MKNDVVKKIIKITGQTCLTALATVTLYKLVEGFFYRKFAEEIYDEAYNAGVDDAYTDMEEKFQDGALEEDTCADCRCNNYCKCTSNTAKAEDTPQPSEPKPDAGDNT